MTLDDIERSLHTAMLHYVCVFEDHCVETKQHSHIYWFRKIQAETDSRCSVITF